MKTYFKSAELPHTWFHQAAPAGRCPAHERFDGPSYYSYATEIARLIERKGQRAVIINATGYSVSTSRHLHGVRMAIPSGVPVFEIDGLGRGVSLDRIEGPALFDHAVKQSAEAEAKASKARTNKDWHTRRAAEWLEKASQINSFFGLRRKVDGRVVERLKDAALREEKKNAALRAEREREAQRLREIERQKQLRDFEAWKQGHGDAGAFNRNLFPVAFRIEENELVSTLGARVPLESARVALRFILRKRGQDWRENGETCPVGHYRLNAINGAGIVAGCHRVTWEEIDRIAPQILFATDASETKHFTSQPVQA